MKKALSPKARPTDEQLVIGERRAAGLLFGAAWAPPNHKHRNATARSMIADASKLVDRFTELGVVDTGNPRRHWPEAMLAIVKTDIITLQEVTGAPGEPAPNDTDPELVCGLTVKLALDSARLSLFEPVDAYSRRPFPKGPSRNPGAVARFIEPDNGVKLSLAGAWAEVLRSVERHRTGTVAMAAERQKNKKDLACAIGTWAEKNFAANRRKNLPGHTSRANVAEEVWKHWDAEAVPWLMKQPESVVAALERVFGLPGKTYPIPKGKAPGRPRTPDKPALVEYLGVAEKAGLITFDVKSGRPKK